MIQENYQDQGIFNQPPGQSFYSYQDQSLNDERDLIPFFLRELTFEVKDRHVAWVNLSNEEVDKLKQIIDKIYRQYEARKIGLLEIEGIWALLTFSFTNRNGLILYLNFQRLLEPLKQTSYQQNSEIKQQFIQFKAEKYFQENNAWIKSRSFMKSIKNLQKYCKGNNVEEIMRNLYKLLKITAIQDVDYLLAVKDFQQSYGLFKQRVNRQSRESKKMKSLVKYNGLFKQRIFSQNVIMSEPDSTLNVFQYFTKEEYCQKMAYSRPEYQQDARNKCRTVQQQISELEDQIDAQQSSTLLKEANLRIEEENASVATYPIKKSISNRTRTQITKTMRYSPQKKQIKIEREFKRIPRYRIIEKMYDLKEKQNILLKQIKKQKQKQVNVRKKKKRLQIIQHRKNYFSEEEESEQFNIKQQRSKNQRNNQQFMQIQSDYEESRFSMPNQMREEDQNSQEIFTMKRKRPTKRLPIQKQNYNESIENGDMYYENEFEYHTQSDDEELVSRKIIERVEPINLKQDKSIVFLRRDKERVEGKTLQKLHNLQIRNLKLDDTQDLRITIFIYDYINFLKGLNNQKQIRKQVISVCQQRISRQSKLIDIDVTLKMLALFMMCQNQTIKCHTIWQKYQQHHIYPMLKHCLSVSIYAALSEILINLFVSYKNQDLTQLSDLEKYFKLLFQVCHCSEKCKNMIIETIFQSLITPKKMQKLKSSIFYDQKCYIGVQNPFKLGTRHIKFNLSDHQSTIAFIIASFLFESLFLWPILDPQVYLQKRKIYLQQLTNEFQQIKHNKDSKLMQTLDDFIFYLQKIFKLYKPRMSEDYFLKIVNIINISLHKLCVDSINNDKDQQISRQIEFICSVFKEYIQYELSINREVSCLSLLNKLTIKNKFNQFYEQPSNKNNIIIYSSVVGLISSYNIFQNDKIQSRFMKYLNQKVKSRLDEVINRINAKECQSIFSLLLNIYKQKLQNSIKQSNDDFTMVIKDNRLCQKNQHFDEIRDFIHLIFAKLDRKYQQLGIMLQNNQREYQKLSASKANSDSVAKDVQKIKGIIKKVQAIILKYLNMFIMSPDQKAETQNIYEKSISHYFFGLQFLVANNYFFKYFKNRAYTANTVALTGRCGQMLSYWFCTLPSFMSKLQIQNKYQKMQIQEVNQNDIVNDSDDFDFQLLLEEREKYRRKQTKNQQLIRYFYIILNQSKIKENYQIMIMSQLKNKQHFKYIAQIYGIQLIEGLQFAQKDQKLYENCIMKYLQECVKESTLSVPKIQKSVYFVNYIFRQIAAFVDNKAQLNPNSAHLIEMHSNISKIKHSLCQFLLFKNIKSIIFIIFLGFCLKNSSQFSELPIEQFLLNLKKLKLVDEKQLTLSNKDLGYTFLIFAIQNAQRLESISDIFSQMHVHYLDYSLTLKVELSKHLNKLFLDLFTVFRKLLNLQRDKEGITLQSIKILATVLQYPQLLAESTECIKKYLTEMQIISKGSSLIAKIKINEHNMSLMLKLFQNISNLKENPYKIKETMEKYISIITDFSKSDQAHVKQIKRVLIVTSQCINGGTPISKFAKQFMNQILKDLCKVFPSWNPPINHNLSSRIQIILEMMRDAKIERAIYEKYFIDYYGFFEKYVELAHLYWNKNGDIRHQRLLGVCTFEEIISICLIGQHSDFLQVKRLISIVFKKGKDDVSKTIVLNKILLKFSSEINKIDYNRQLEQWCELKLKELNQFRNELIKEESQ